MKLINLECKDVITKLQAQLGLQSVDVVYDALEITKTRLKWGNHIIYFNAIDNEAEREKYKKKSEEAQIKYKTKSAVIHIPDLKVCQIIDIFKADITGAYDRTCEYLRKIKPSVECPIDLLFIMNIFLHEVGHWQQLYKNNRLVMSYIKLDKELEEAIALTSKKLSQRIQELSVRCLESYKPSEKMIKKLTALEEKYRMIPKEAEADAYAKMLIEEMDMKKYLSSLEVMTKE